MRARLLGPLLFLAVAALVGCDSTPEGTSTPTPIPTIDETESPRSTATQSPLVGYADDVRTHGPADPVIDAFLRERVTALLDLVDFRRHECAGAGNEVPPPCPPALDPSAALAGAIPLRGCDITWATDRDTVRAALNLQAAERVLYGVSQVAAEHAPADQVVAFAWRRADGVEHGIAFLLDGERISAVDRGCGEPASALFGKYASGEARLPPATVADAPAPPLPPPPGYERGVLTGNATVDAVVDAYLSNDGAALSALARPTVYECVEQGALEYGPPPVCPDGVEVGTPMEVLGSVGCHGGYITPDQLAEAATPPPQTETRLFAVVESEDGFGREYVAIFARRFPDGRVWGLALTIAEEGLTSFDTGCLTSPEEMLARWGAPTFLLPPMSNPETSGS